MTPAPLRGLCRAAAGPVPAAAVEPVVMRRIARRTDDGPISGEAVTERMMAICGCKGAYDCDCVTVEKQARRELWTEHNQRLHEAAGTIESP